MRLFEKVKYRKIVWRGVGQTPDKKSGSEKVMKLLVVNLIQYQRHDYRMSEVRKESKQGSTG